MSFQQRRGGRPQKKAGTRSQIILADPDFESQIQQDFSPPTTTNSATRQLPLDRQRQRDGPTFRLPLLTAMCLEVAARNFLTHILPSRDVFDAATGQPGSSSSSASTSRNNSTIGRSRPVARGIGSKRGDEETEAGGDWTPRKRQKRSRRGSSSGSDDDDDAEGDPTVGVAATPRSMRARNGAESSSASTSSPSRSRSELEELTRDNHEFLKMMPERHRVKLLQLLRQHCPQALTRQILTTYFVVDTHGVELDAGMTLLKDKGTEVNLILRQVATSSTSTLRRLSLSGLTRLDPTALSACFRRCSSLEEVVVKGCIQVNAPCMDALTSTSSKQTLRHINVNFTDVGLEGFTLLVERCPNLEVLKVASVEGLTDRSVPEAIRRATERASFAPLSKLKSLKLRATSLGPVGISSCVQLCAKTLENLDISSLGLLTESGIKTLSAVLGVGGDSATLSATATSSSSGPPPFLPASPIKPRLKKLNISSNVPPGQSSIIRPRELTIALDHLVRNLLPAFADTLEVLLLDDLGLAYGEWDVLEEQWWKARRKADRRRTKAVVTLGTRETSEADGSGVRVKTEEDDGQMLGAASTLSTEPLATLRRLSLAGNQPTILRWQDLWQVDYASHIVGASSGSRSGSSRSGSSSSASPPPSAISPSSSHPRLKTIVEDLDLSRMDLRSITQAKFLVSGGSPYSYYQKNAAAAASPSGRQTQAQRTASLVHNASSSSSSSSKKAPPPCPRDWSSLRSLNLSTTQLTDRELKVLRLRLSPSLLLSVKPGSGVMLGIDDDYEWHSVKGWQVGEAPWDAWLTKEARKIGECKGESPLGGYEVSGLREVSLAGTSVTGDAVRSLIATPTVLEEDEEEEEEEDSKKKVKEQSRPRLPACPFVETIDLTGCRGVDVRERRGIWQSIAGEG